MLHSIKIFPRRRPRKRSIITKYIYYIFAILMRYRTSKKWPSDPYDEAAKSFFVLIILVLTNIMFIFNLRYHFLYFLGTPDYGPLIILKIVVPCIAYFFLIDIVIPERKVRAIKLTDKEYKKGIITIFVILFLLFANLTRWIE